MKQAHKTKEGKMKKLVSIVIIGFLTILFLENCSNSTKSIYVTHENESKLMAMYDAKLTQWPVPYESIIIPTSFGKTHIIASGPKDAPPILFLHAFGLNATMWLSNVKELSRNYRIYTLDTIGDLGKSVLDDFRKYPKNGKAYSMWLSELSDKLGIEKVHVIGASFGGWITMNHAIYSPERVNKIVLLGPMGIPSATLKVVFRLTSLLLFPTDSKKERMVKWALGDNPLAIEAFAEYMQIAMNCRSQSAIPMKISNKKLNSIKAPALLFLGGNDGPIGDAEKSANRAQNNIPDIQVEILPKAGHLMSTEEPDFVNNRILTFLKE